MADAALATLEVGALAPRGPAVVIPLAAVPVSIGARPGLHGVRIDGHIVLLCTGFHARHWPRRESVTMNPGLTAAASHWLSDRSRVHGVEGPSTDKAGTKAFPNHRVCRDRGMVHYEWLVNLEQLVGQGEFRFTGFPLKWLGGTGSVVVARRQASSMAVCGAATSVEWMP